MEVLATSNRKRQFQTAFVRKNQLFRSHLDDPDSVAKRYAYHKAKRRLLKESTVHAECLA